MGEVITHCVAFLIGTVTGSAATYFGNKYTDQRRNQDSKRRALRIFADVEGQMPELIAEMRKDLQTPGDEVIREFFITRKEYILPSSKPRFFYYENDHENLHAKIDILENVGYVVDVTPGNARMCRMTEEFVYLLRHR